ncbi:hypothetical protein [Streptomyces cucumeris]|nr:hypothetical protein [Streptomyces sp. NEAU-Y11]MCP9210426.1 hypothetical protein [Streptomyces sp. NEAU-Y11]
MRRRRQTTAVRAGLYAFRVARAGLILATMVAVLAAAVVLCIAGDPATP